MNRKSRETGFSKLIVLSTVIGVSGLIGTLIVIGFMSYQRMKEVDEIQKVQKIVGVKPGQSQVGNTTLQDSALDIKRTADMRAIQSALEVYRADNDKYPFSLSDLQPYISSVPLDPTTNKQYEYTVGKGGVSYTLKAKLNSGEYQTVQSPQ